MYIAYHPIYNHPVPDNHRFPMLKYALLPQQLLHEGIAQPTDFHTPQKASPQSLCLVHHPDYVHRFIHLQLTHKEALPIGFVQNEQLVERELTLVQGTIDGALWALQHRQVAFNIAGGTHHAFSDRGEGFCMLNDQAVAAGYLLAHTAVQRILIIDLDVHQGNGTAQIFANDPRVFTFSMHAQHNYPFQKEQSSLDIPLPNGTTDEVYLRILQDTLPQLIAQHQPQFVFYQSGVDVLATDKLGKLSLSVEGCAERDKFVFQQCKAHQLPVQCAMGGGYSPQLRHILRAHSNTFAVSE
ncbi:histone deacetylase family protein [Capnocytophaga sp. oral taxon 332 str. F0381]|uniref:histone deacetylase family protein n=1 Tax=Capnocytophaga sp. oral taxon 332 TaxID=712213 RepID=UPI0002A3A5FA|nr:histone deacetylase [Capnocytophaga sp. oral taxon 332]EKY11918.1 histone deacetylase family protein [Capnocytophaga sp. oral taxon 332 str. F0381]